MTHHSSLTYRHIATGYEENSRVASGTACLVLAGGIDNFSIRFLNPVKDEILLWRVVGPAHVLLIPHQTLQTLPHLHVASAYFINCRPPVEMETIVGEEGPGLAYLFSLLGLGKDKVEPQFSPVRMAAALIILRLRELIRQAHPPEQYSRPFRLAARFTELVEQNYRKEATLPFYARALNITEDHLSRVSQEKLGSRAKQIIQTRRFQEAERLLISSTASVKEIAHQVGFDDANYFSREFKQRFGVPPGTLRANHSSS